MDQSLSEDMPLDPRENPRIRDGFHRSYDPELQIHRFWKTINGEEIFSIHVTTDFNEEMKKERGWKRNRAALQYGIGEIFLDPFGENSLDPWKADPVRQMKTSINRLPDFFNDIHVPVAIKANGVGMPIQGSWIRGSLSDDLHDQFLYMRELELKSRAILTPEQSSVVEFCPPYALITFPDDEIGERQILIMKRIMDAQPIDELSQHPTLTSALHGISWTEINMYLQTIGLPVGDLGSENILYTEDEIASDKKHYTIIDPLRP